MNKKIIKQLEDKLRLRNSVCTDMIDDDNLKKIHELVIGGQVCLLAWARDKAEDITFPIKTITFEYGIIPVYEPNGTFKYKRLHVDIDIKFAISLKIGMG